MIDKIKIPIYRGTICIVIEDTLFDCAKKINFDEVHEEDDSFGMMMYEPRKETYHILLPKKSINRHSTIAHEAKHLVNRLFITKGINLDPENDEPECYLLGWVVDQVYKAIEKYKKCKT